MFGLEAVRLLAGAKSTSVQPRELPMAIPFCCNSATPAGTEGYVGTGRMNRQGDSAAQKGEADWHHGRAH